MSSLSERMSVMPTIEVEANEHYCYRIVKDGVVLGEFAFHLSAISYNQSGIESVELRLTEPNTFKTLTTILNTQ